MYRSTCRLLPLWLSLWAVLAALAACADEDPTDILHPSPVIEWVRVSPGEVLAFRDSVVFEVRYRDGDGDLGSNDPAARNLFITDNRIDVVHELRIRQLAPEGANVPIQGTFTAILPRIIITDGSSRQGVTFTLYIADRAGNQSEPVTSEEIFVVE